MIATGMVPHDFQYARIALMPVNDVARGLVTIAAEPGTLGGNYNLLSTRYCSRICSTFWSPAASPSALCRPQNSSTN
ncbi:hypothetical protein F5544_30335 [Nocardia arthritidis]|uniref:Uncharacterized protein n=1 Tax=Nocardia arthritidis TaxID=228602 RepID=A0A6G9YL55_9NOCA|nr:hypothetical protein F5544_30335 [Nocardia arthritidis]